MKSIFVREWGGFVKTNILKQVTTAFFQIPSN
jgi:hypothetical protein